MIAGPAQVDGHTVSASFRTDLEAHDVYWALPGNPDGNVEDAVLATAILPAMAAEEPLTIERPVSGRLLSNLATIQDVFETWSRDKELNRGWTKVFRRVSVDATARPSSTSTPARGVAAFFTGGVDSFYTAMKRRDELTALVYVHGFDVALEDVETREQVVSGVRAAASELALPLVEVETDVRAFSERSVKWLDYHGAALAGVALLLAPWFGRMYVSATTTYASLSPLGSHPLIDPLWSTENLELMHDGCEATRLEKLDALAHCEAARRWLRVCPKNWGATYNCGRCTKCLRTMVAARLLGPSPPFESLPVLDDDGLRRLARAKVPGDGETYKLYLRMANGRDRALARALRSALWRSRARELGLSVVRPLRSSRSRP
jgi:hypothetical protein